MPTLRGVDSDHNVIPNQGENTAETDVPPSEGEETPANLPRQTSKSSGNNSPQKSSPPSPVRRSSRVRKLSLRAQEEVDNSKAIEKEKQKKNKGGQHAYRGRRQGRRHGKQQAIVEEEAEGQELEEEEDGGKTSDTKQSNRDLLLSLIHI